MGKKAREERRAQARKGRLDQQAEHDIVAGLGAIATDPAVPADEAALAIRALYGRDEINGPQDVYDIAKTMTRERAGLLIDQIAASASPEDAESLRVAASIAEGQHDEARCVALYRQALAIEPDDDATKWLLAIALQACDRHADALEIMVARVRQDPLDDLWQSTIGPSLEAASEEMDDDNDARPCVCGSGKVFGACCAKPMVRALSWFDDRYTLEQLRMAAAAFAATDTAAPFLAYARSVWLEAAGAEPEESDAALYDEWAWQVMPGEDVPDEHGHDHASDEADDVSILSLFADASAGTPLADDAKRWATEALWGLWTAPAVHSEPGLRLKDIVTGRTVYAAVPHAARSVFAHGIVLGQLVAVDGVWRLMSGLLPLTVGQANTAAILVAKLVDHVAYEDGGSRRPDPFAGMTPVEAAKAGVVKVSGLEGLCSLVTGASVPHIVKIAAS